ncbi:phage head closure protein [Aurantimonas sp. 22II-16-19i]|uniref:phage head closure protein n=1 Tax=Aurantimonas sp. 22II-16-19i TaxID=1317114 RepID=UPI0009F7CAF9|nr:phage head closure protein [Aurantimonas sp. 22II-16-19i]ORE90155.1 phage head-tail adaptor [Aurantimonas sp. 22II-16-19i]
MIRAGKLDRRITIERESETVDDAGRVTRAWAPIGSLRAEIVRLSTGEFLKGFGEEATTGIVFRTRFFADITTADRIAFDGDAFNVREIVEIGRRRGLEIRCEAPE